MGRGMAKQKKHTEVGASADEVLAMEFVVDGHRHGKKPLFERQVWRELLAVLSSWEEADESRQPRQGGDSDSPQANTTD